MIRHARRAFTLAEVLVSVALVAILAAVVIPTIRGRLREGYSAAIVAEFQDIGSALSAYRQNVGKYPQSLDYLFALPTVTPKDFCNINLPTSAINSWRGPYLNRAITAAGPNNYWLVGNDDTVEVVMGSTTVNNVQLIELFIDGPDLQTAQDVDTKLDGIPDAANGSLQYIARGNGYRLEYMIPSRGC
jgi:prepilin-type N-terminal cleavage/methylation domain-containing protein